MLFNSWEFALFFLAVVAIYGRLSAPRQNGLLLAASYFFYGWWDWRFLGLIFISTLVDFTVARAIADVPSTDAGLRRRRVLVIVSVVTNLGILGFFKYFGFFTDSAELMLTRLGFRADLPTLEIILPVGISFYTFQTMAYTIDVYRRHAAPCRDLLQFALYVCFFPQLVAGPIERSETLIPQLAIARRFDRQQVFSGAHLVFIGLVKKVGIADVLAVEVARIFSDPGAYSSSALAYGVLLFALQIYGDFSGYSAMARGLSRILGIELSENFQQPYFSTSITEFWRRWHMSLSSWLRDYLYIPLGGNRGGSLKTYRNLMLTMLLGGLWHGAAFTFVVWGALHGAALAAHRLFSTFTKGAARTVRASTVGRVLAATLGWLTTMTVVLVAWVFFRAETLADALRYVSGLAALRGGAQFEGAPLFFACLAIVLLIDIPLYRHRDQNALMRWPWPARAFLYATLTIWMVVLDRPSDAPFIYFQF